MSNPRDNGDEIGSVAMTGLSMEEFSCNGISFVELLTRVEREPLLQHERINGSGFQLDDDCYCAEFKSPIAEQNDKEVDEMSFISPEQLPEESVETDAFYSSYANKSGASYTKAATASNASRCFPSFNQSDAESAPQEVSSAKVDNLSDTMEASVRKYCEDKSYDMFKPEVGMRFDTCEDAYKFYNMYSWVLGFSIRCGDNYTNKKGHRTVQEYKCQREGVEKGAKISTTRCGCKAMIRLAISDDSTWYIKAFIGDHDIRTCPTVDRTAGSGTKKSKKYK